MSLAVDHRAVPPETELAELAAAFEHAKQEALTSPAGMATFCDPSYRRPAHVELISAELAKVLTGETKRLLIRTPPQVGKTRLAAVWGPFWWLANHPHHRVIIGSYSNNLAVARGRQVRRLVDVHGWRYQLQREYGEGSVADWALTTGGGVKSAGVKGGITGASGDLGIVDDPHKGRQEAESRLVRDTVDDWYSGDFLSRLSPGAPIVIIQTPWHEDDLGNRRIREEGRVEEGGEWRVVDLPAFAGPADPLGREAGAPLTHPKIAEHDVAALTAFWEGRRRGTSARDWVSLYMLDPKPVTEALVTKEMLRARTHVPVPAAPRRAVVAVDPSGGGRDNAGVVGGFLGDDRRCYITEDRSLHGPSEAWGAAAVELAADLDADLIVFEPNYGGDMAGVVIRTEWATARRKAEERNARLPAGAAPDTRFRRHPPLVAAAPHAKKNKQLRAEPIAQQINDDQVRFGAAMPELKQQWTSWRPTDRESPGNLDASVYLAYELLPIDNEPSEVQAAPATPLPGVTPSLPTMLPGAGMPGGVQVVPALGDLQARQFRR